MLREIKELKLNLSSVTFYVLAAGNVCDKGIYDNSVIALVEKSHRIRASVANMQNKSSFI